MGVQFNKYLTGSRIYCCRHCHTHFGYDHDVESRDFHGQLGQAYLVRNVVNITFCQPEKRKMMTGEFLVRDISCRICDKNVGWVYVKAFNTTEEYKVGKFILETEQIREIKA